MEEFTSEDTAFASKWIVRQGFQKLYSNFGCNLPKKVSNFCSSITILPINIMRILSVQVAAIIPGFSKKSSCLYWSAFDQLYWPNLRENLNKPVLQKGQICDKCAMVANGINTCWNVELIGAYHMPSFAPSRFWNLRNFCLWNLVFTKPLLWNP